MTTREPITLADYRNSDDPNIYWRISDGNRENLLDEAVDLLDRREAKLRELVEMMGEEAKTMARHIALDDWMGATEYWKTELEAVLKEST